MSAHGGWPTYSNKNVRLSDGLIHRVAHAYGNTYSSGGRIRFACCHKYESWATPPSGLVTNEPLTCLGCMDWDSHQ